MSVEKNRPWHDGLEENIKALNAGDQGIISWVFCILAGDDDNDKSRAAEALNNILRKLDFNDIIRTDMRMRQTTSIEWDINWREKDVNDFFTPTMNTEERQAVLIFASFNPNGFIREKAVRMLSEYDGSLPYIILRQNDWVLQVRQAASAAFDKRMGNLSRGELLDALPFAEKLNRSSRGSHGEYTQRFFDKLSDPKHSEDLVKGLRSHNVRTRRICISALFEASRPDIDAAVDQLKHEPEPFLRAILFERMRDTGRDMTVAAHIMLVDKFARNRALALQYLNDKQTEDIYDISVKALFDANAHIRAFARGIVKQHAPDFDFRAVYLENIKQFGAPAILGAGETGQASDAESIEAYVNDNRPAAARAALISLMRLDAKKYETLVTEKLTAGGVGIVKTAQKLIIKYNIADYNRIFEIFQESPYEYTKVKCLAVLFKAPKWDRLIYMLEALSFTEENIAQSALWFVQIWLSGFNKSFARATDEQKDRIGILLDKHKEKLPAAFTKEVRFLSK
jgi:hypothetical protein